jgi:hypothetical protein
MTLSSLRLLAIFCLLATACAPVLRSPAQVLGPQVLVTPQGRVEVIGLKRWTVEELAEAFRQHAPERSLFSSACKVILRDSLGFPDAAVVRRRVTSESGKQSDRVTITVVEPADAARIQFRPAPPQALPLRAEWRAALAPFSDAQNQLLLGPFMFSLQLYGFVASGQAETAHKYVEASGEAREAAILWAFLQSRQSEEDPRLGLWTLEHSRRRAGLRQPGGAVGPVG